MITFLKIIYYKIVTLFLIFIKYIYILHDSIYDKLFLNFKQMHLMLTHTPKFKFLKTYLLLLYWKKSIDIILHNSKTIKVVVSFSYLNNIKLIKWKLTLTIWFNAVSAPNEKSVPGTLLLYVTGTTIKGMQNSSYCFRKSLITIPVFRA